MLGFIFESVEFDPDLIYQVAVGGVGVGVEGFFGGFPFYGDVARYTSECRRVGAEADAELLDDGAPVGGKEFF